MLIRWHGHLSQVNSNTNILHKTQSSQRYSYLKYTTICSERESSQNMKYQFIMIMYLPRIWTGHRRHKQNRTCCIQRLHQWLVGYMYALLNMPVALTQHLWTTWMLDRTIVCSGRELQRTYDSDSCLLAISIYPDEMFLYHRRCVQIVDRVIEWFGKTWVACILYCGVYSERATIELGMYPCERQPSRPQSVSSPLLYVVVAEVYVVPVHCHGCSEDLG